MPVNVQISLNPHNPWERLVVRIADSATDDDRSLNNVAALLLPVIELVESALLRRRLGLAHGVITIRSGPQQLHLRMPRPTDPPCDGVLYQVEVLRNDKVGRLWDKLHARQGLTREEEAEGVC